MSLDLPNGIFYNRKEEDLLEVLLPYEVVEAWICSRCNLTLEATMIGENGRFQGTITAVGSQTSSWQGKLPKNEDKARKYLKDNLLQRIERHRIIAHD